MLVIVLPLLICHPLLDSSGQGIVLDGPWDDQILTSFCP